MIDPIRSALLSATKPFNFALLVILIVVLSVAGPFGTFETISFGGHLIYWGAVVIVSAVIGDLAAHIARSLTQRQHPIVTDLVATALMAVTFGPLNLYLARVMLTSTNDAGPTLFEMMGYVSAIAFAIFTGRRFIPGLEEQNYLPRTHDSNRPRLLRRLPAADQCKVLRLSSQGHFVDVITERGVTRLRMRLADAINEMDSVSGYCTHRSHWVAESAIVTVEKAQGKLNVRLSNGDSVPISRKYRPNLEEAGLF
jgi:hypothetical protein